MVDVALNSADCRNANWAQCTQRKHYIKVEVDTVKKNSFWLILTPWKGRGSCTTIVSRLDCDGYTYVYTYIYRGEENVTQLIK